MHRRLDLAYTTLMDAAKRKEYDLELFPDGVPMPVTPSAVAATHAPPPRPPAKGEDPATLTVRPPMPESDAATEFSGPLLRQIREAVGVELREIAERSKIGMAYLQALEGEVFAKLPAPVYVRGFLVGVRARTRASTPSGSSRPTSIATAPRAAHVADDRRRRPPSLDPGARRHLRSSTWLP